MALAAVLVFVLVGTGLDHRVYYDLLYSVTARQATAGASTDAQKADALDQYVFSNVHVPAQALLDDDGPPAETLLGAYGVCDQQVRLFMSLAEKIGLSTREIFLLDTNSGTSPHTVAEVWENNRWAWLDVLYGYTPTRQDGSPATLQDLIARSDPIIGLTGLKPAEYENNRVQLAMQPNGLGDAIERFIPQWLANRLQDLYLLLPPPVIPAEQGTSHFDTPDGRLYWAGRNYQVFGRQAAAVSAFQKLLQRYPDSPYANDARYDLALMDKTTAPQKTLNELDQLKQSAPAYGIGADGGYLAAQVQEQLRTSQSCADAIDGYSQVVAQASSNAPAAVLRLGQTPCVKALPKPLADFGPLDLSGLQVANKSVSLLWQVTAPMSQDYTIFVHALDAQGKVVAQNDSQPDGGILPTSRQMVGALVPDDHSLAVPSSAVQLEIGAYELSTGQRLKQPDGTDAYRVPLAQADRGLGGLAAVDASA